MGRNYQRPLDDNFVGFLTKYDDAGNVTRRTADGHTQTLVWDALNRLVKVTQGTTVWKMTYDGLGRRIRMSEKIGSGTEHLVDYVYDPLVEFLELGRNDANGRSWKVYGPDSNGAYGGLQGCGGLEAVVKESAPSAPNGVVTDYFGNVLASPGSTTRWAAALGGYGALPGSATVNAQQLPEWRSKDPSGFYYLGARYYEPKTGRFLSCDPLGADASLSLYDYCDGDPVNNFDPDGRFGKGFESGQSSSISGDAATSLAFSR